MVHIIRRRPKRHPLVPSHCFRVLLGCIRFVVLTAVIPTMFVLRYCVQQQTTSADSTRVSSGDASRDKIASPDGTASSPTSPNLSESLKHFLRSIIDHDGDNIPKHFAFVELYHCNVANVNLDAFWNKAVEPILYQTVDALSKDLTASEVLDMQQEFLLELLEQYATFEGLCDYNAYRPTVPRDNNSIQRVASILQTRNTTFRHIYIISAYQDVSQLNELIDAIYDDMHLILVHLEGDSNADFVHQIDRRALFVSFGTIVYKTDSLSLINLRLLRWLTFDLSLQYDFVFLLNGVTYPLIHRNELLQLNESVYLGELHHRGEPVNTSSDMLLFHKRLIHTQTKRHKRLRTMFWKPYSIEPSMELHMNHKSVSGNQGIYRRQVIIKLLENDEAMKLFAHAKFGCCNVLEERTWVAALDIIGYREVALKYPSVFQVWGGFETCQGSMHNAILSTNRSLCYRNEHPGFDVYFQGNETLQHLEKARRNGFIFARKFQSDNQHSTAIQRYIRDQLWQKQPAPVS